MQIEQALKTYANQDSDQPTKRSDDHDFPAGDQTLFYQEATLLGTFKANAQNCLQELKMQSEVLKQQKKSLEEQLQKFGQFGMKESFTNLIVSVDNEIRSAEIKKSLVEQILEISLTKRIAQLTSDIEWIERVKMTSSNETNESGWDKKMMASIQSLDSDQIR